VARKINASLEMVYRFIDEPKLVLTQVKQQMKG